MAKAFNLPDNKAGVKLIKQIYDTWDTSEFTRFSDYVASLRSSAVEESVTVGD